MFRKERNEPLGVFVRCGICGNFIPYDAEMCEYCGSIITYDDEKSQYFIDKRICFKCGFENKKNSLFCESCRNKFAVTCPKCKVEVEIEESYCKRCGLRIDEFYIQNEMNKRLMQIKTERSKKIGLFVTGAMFLSLTVFLVYLSLEKHYGGMSTIAFRIAAIIFFSLFIVTLKNLIELMRKTDSR